MPNTEGEGDRRFIIHVNGAQYEVPGHHASAAAIKQLCGAESSFALFVEENDGQARHLRDDEVVDVAHHQGVRFYLVPPAVFGCRLF